MLIQIKDQSCIILNNPEMFMLDMNDGNKLIRVCHGFGKSNFGFQLLKFEKCVLLEKGQGHYGVTVTGNK